MGSVDLTRWYARGYTADEPHPLHLLRNPHGQLPALLRDARLWAADEIEHLAKGDDRVFPVKTGTPIPWAFIAPHRARAERNHGGQTLERLAERGGLAPSEIVAVLENRPWQPMADAPHRLLQLLMRWKELR